MISKTYQNQLQVAAKENIDWSQLQEKKIMITGASGLIGSCIVDILMQRNNLYKNSNIKIIAVGRNENEAKEKFIKYWDNENFKFIKHDIINEIKIKDKANYIIHAASNASPIAFSREPVNTILGNINGTENLLNYAIQNKTEKFLFVSSGEIYGQVSENIDDMDEKYRGYINNLEIRSAYPISKLASENLCIAYSEQYNIHTIIARPCHIYGHCFTSKDSRAYAEFLRKAIKSEDIIMKSKGEQMRSYCYVVDCAMAIIYMLINGENKNAYNISNKNSNVTIYKLAETIAKIANVNIKFENPNEVEKNGFNKVTKSILNSSKLEKLGWKPKYDLDAGIYDTIKILNEKSYNY